MIKVSVPGSAMLFGEHAVLSGQEAIVAAVNQRIDLTLTLRDEMVLSIDSNLGDYQCTLPSLKQDTRFRFIIAVVEAYQYQLKTGLHFRIRSEFSHTVGLGSSAAVTVGAVAAILKLIENKKTDNENLFLQARKIMQDVQGVGSGADVAASCFGGVQLYSMSHHQPIDWPWAIALFYSGHKTPTTDVLSMLQAQYHSKDAEFKQEINCIAEATSKAIKAAETSDNVLLKKACVQHQAAMKRLGLTTDALDALIDMCYAKSMIAAKISGSGLGDSVVGFGHFIENECEGVSNNMAVSVDREGVVFYD